MPRIYVSTSCLTGKYSLEEKLGVYDSLGIKNVELGICNDPSLDAKNIINKYNFNYLIHHYFPAPKESIVINLASQNRQIYRKSLAQMLRSIDFCAANRIPLFSFHAGFRGDPSIGEINFKFDQGRISDYGVCFETFKEALARITDHAKKRKVGISMENNVISENQLIDGENKICLMCELQEFKSLFSDTRYANLGMLLDLGHLRVASNLLNFDPYRFISSLKNKVSLIHINDNNGRIDDHQPINQESWTFKALNNYFKGTNMPVVLESKCKTEKELEGMLRLLETMNET